jgi:hypothetical protein
MENPQTSFNEKIYKAKEIYEKKKLILMDNPVIKDYLIKLHEYIRISKIERDASNVSQGCRECGVHKKDCCGSGIERRYSKEILVINIVLGVRLPEKPAFEDKCYFLTENGCLLLARDVFCVNYICKPLRESIPLERLRRLQESENKELETLFKLEELIKSLFS